jgi:hypothetical protein
LTANENVMGKKQVISSPVTGPIFSNGGAITVTSTGSIAGNPTGVEALDFSITTLTNSGAINGALGATSAAGGLGVSNLQTIGTLTNNGLIDGGVGGNGARRGGAGGAGVSNAAGAKIKSLTNQATGVISGGAGGSGPETGGVAARRSRIPGQSGR